MAEAYVKEEYPVGSSMPAGVEFYPAGSNTAEQQNITPVSAPAPTVTKKRSKNSAGKPAKQFICKWEECRRIFGKLEHLQRHERSHAGDLPFQCATCEKRFARNDVMQRHSMLHTGGKTSISKVSRKVACSFCAALKMRCDGGTPCTRCEKKSLECTYLKPQATASGAGGTKTRPSAKQISLQQALPQPVSAPASPPDQATAQQLLSMKFDEVRIVSANSSRHPTPGSSPPPFQMALDPSLQLDLHEQQQQRYKQHYHNLPPLQTDPFQQVPIPPSVATTQYPLIAQYQQPPQISSGFNSSQHLSGTNTPSSFHHSPDDLFSVLNHPLVCERLNAYDSGSSTTGGGRYYSVSGGSTPAG